MLSPLIRRRVATASLLARAPAGVRAIRRANNASTSPSDCSSTSKRTPHDVIRLHREQPGPSRCGARCCRDLGIRAAAHLLQPRRRPDRRMPARRDRLLRRDPGPDPGYQGGLRTADRRPRPLRDARRGLQPFERYNWERPIAPRLYDGLHRHDIRAVSRRRGVQTGPGGPHRLSVSGPAHHLVPGRAEPAGGGALLPRPQHAHALVEPRHGPARSSTAWPVRGAIAPAAEGDCRAPGKPSPAASTRPPTRPGAERGRGTAGTARTARSGFCDFAAALVARCGRGSCSSAGPARGS